MFFFTFGKKRVWLQISSAQESVNGKTGNNGGIQIEWECMKEFDEATKQIAGMPLIGDHPNYLRKCIDEPEVA